MKKILLSILILQFSISIYSQNLYVTKRDYSNPVNYIHTLQKINVNNGFVIENNNYTSSFPGSYSPRSLVFNQYTNEVIGLSDTNIITKKNILNGNESTITLPLESSTDYQGIVVFNNRLFVTKRDYSNPVNYIVEYGPSGNVPIPEIPDVSKMSVAERKIWGEQQKKFSSQFTPVEEFEDIKFEISEEVMVLGVGIGDQKGLIQEGTPAIYFYPTGEKDSALFFFGTIEEFAYLEVSPFLNKTKNYFEPLNTESVSRIEDILQTKMTTIYREWRL